MSDTCLWKFWFLQFLNFGYMFYALLNFSSSISTLMARNLCMDLLIPNLLFPCVWRSQVKYVTSFLIDQKKFCIEWRGQTYSLRKLWPQYLGWNSEPCCREFGSILVAGMGHVNKNYAAYWLRIYGATSIEQNRTSAKNNKIKTKKCTRFRHGCKQTKLCVGYGGSGFEHVRRRSAVFECALPAGTSLNRGDFVFLACLFVCFHFWFLFCNTDAAMRVSSQMVP